ncbi:MAG: outer membrane protein assembly factor BamD [Bacteroidia bacterium]|jgi:outer membrane protein assembly factor BamD|nr:outer membrane protein assembly factor BamD [Bacteroidales bacterium]NCD41558.1 outer membrane protein assembly factor BamD [Bacteroidia bacterium]MDD2322329.1 outer membrane protein assembly factor BamD [Bacteroidales bacterium]MDD3009885.1 outer membrane protein assembly factor BamD [Bacteroidales bacterium]MDD3961468.1 outer membrane protein assembly factor BamD [Bacteroidales bacterium]
MKKINSISVVLLVLILTTSCGGVNKLLKSNDSEAIYNEGVSRYEKEDYTRALQLFDHVSPLLRGTSKAEDLAYYNAYCYYNLNENIMASYYFKRFAKEFPRSKYAEECAYMGAYCKYLESPKYSLDQSNTYEAITELQLFINLYPSSTRIEECNQLIDELRNKLERKDFEIAKLYLQMEEYKAALTSLNNVIKNYPSSTYKEDVLYYLVLANYEYAQNSVSDKQKERYQQTLEATHKFSDAFPESNYKKNIEQIIKDSRLKAE